MENIEDQVFDIMEENLGSRPDGTESDLIDDLGADSLDIVEIVMDIEEKFDVVIHEDDYSGKTKAGDFVQIVAAKKGAAL